MARKKSNTAPRYIKVPVEHLQGLMSTRTLGLVREYFNKSFEVVSNDATLDQVQREYNKLSITLEEREVTYVFLRLAQDLHPTEDVKKSLVELETELRTLKEGQQILESALVQQYREAEAAGELQKATEYSLDHLMEGVTPGSLGPEISWGPAVGNEFPNGYDSPTFAPFPDIPFVTHLKQGYTDEELAQVKRLEAAYDYTPEKQAAAEAAIRDMLGLEAPAEEPAEAPVEPVPSGYDIEVEEGESPI